MKLIVVFLATFSFFIPGQSKGQDEHFGIKLQREGEAYAACVGCGAWIYSYRGDWYFIEEEQNSPVITGFPVSRVSSNVVYAWRTYYCSVAELSRKTDALRIPRNKRIQAGCTSAGWVLLSL
jgi:hypothetical protein